MDSSGFELVAESVDERNLRTDSHQRDLLHLTRLHDSDIFFAKGDDLLVLFLANGDVGALCQTSGTSVTRRHKHMLHFLTLSQLPSNCVLAATSTDYKNVRHYSKISRRSEDSLYGASPT